MKGFSVLIGILNYNNPELTYRCYQSLSKMKGSYNFLVIDNGSEKENRRKLKEYFSGENFTEIEDGECKNGDVEKNRGNFLLYTGDNMGYSRANNLGMNIALKNDYDFYLLSNNDIFVEDKDTLIKLIEPFRIFQNIIISGPKIRNSNGSFTKPVYGFGLYDLVVEKLFFPLIYLFKKLKEVKKDEKKHPYYLSGCFMLIDLKKFFRIGLFDENLFLYAEELVIAEKSKKNNYYFYYVESATVLHEHEATTSKFFKEKELYFLRMNSILYFLKRYKKYDRIKLSLVKFSWVFYYYIWLKLIRSFKNHKNKFMKG